MIRDANDRRDKIDALAVRFQDGEFTETVYRASLYASGLRGSDINHIVNRALEQKLSNARLVCDKRWRPKLPTTL